MAQKILIIDDDQYIRELYVEVLTDEKYDVDSTQDGIEGVEKIMKNKYDLILLDIMMPRLDGLGVLQKLHDKKHSVRNIVLLTNLSHGPVIDEGTKLGAVGYLIKADITPDQLVEKVKEYLK
ncbi:hypothetical protein A2690_00990 [Candidatus Roizmanbacteria bacterium RIFCSPHIGHO2_01_FULL_39_12b]|uniref:Response regulatory domain-containing protein n=1 Tax=Candidatus Roizmanbacteria bacterium RIFCSPHIGHO2_01_FULL_39_12b TaxID=1802030 RepID=A0A1F7GAU9_9BACT|nr:MAG: hypothetical protein A2690_00990 [Candidatus Roizmanbacteria bacterium RIFCSPHIGHO2_01_FULL_39_12b]OGK47342.1 MAG: hypothetical protein A3B46_02145 [Candidatus Roizmanbacteria bacterium RIFCSPLOWO2_01_FULL_39_19]